jgi:hypothetical protein
VTQYIYLQNSCLIKLPPQASAALAKPFSSVVDPEKENTRCDGKEVNFSLNRIKQIPQLYIPYRTVTDWFSEK